MANVTNTLLRINNAYIIDYVYDDFKSLARSLKQYKGIDISVYQSYMSEYNIIDELRQRHKRKQTLYLDQSIKQLVVSGKYDEIKAVIETSSQTDFHPPLSSPYSYQESNVRQPASSFATSQAIFPVPTYPREDPRRTGRLVIPTPTNLFKYPEAYQWLLVNSITFGFVVYLDIGLLWEGVDSIHRRLRSNQTREQVAGRYLKSPDLLNFTNNNMQFRSILESVDGAAYALDDDYLASTDGVFANP